MKNWERQTMTPDWSYNKQDMEYFDAYDAPAEVQILNKQENTKLYRKIGYGLGVYIVLALLATLIL